jgi:hypothetical protein
MNNMELEIVSEFIHMGTMFQRTGSFKKNKVNLAVFEVFGNVLTPCTFLIVKKVSKSFRYSANRKACKCSPCLTPFKHGRKFETVIINNS